MIENGLDAGIPHDGRPHDTCAFRDADGEFALNYGKLGHGEVHTVYPQHKLVADLTDEYLRRGGTLRFGETVTSVDPATATVRFSGAKGVGQATGQFVVGFDGSNGVTNGAVLTTSTIRYARDHGISWLAILAEAPPSLSAVTYAMHDNGFAGHMTRSPQVTRYYLQVEPHDDPAVWSDERIWCELGVRMWTNELGPLQQGKVLASAFRAILS